MEVKAVTHIPSLAIYYDGLCPLCSREIAHYRKQEGSEKLTFVDITAPSFDAKKEGLVPHAVHRVMHVRTAEGELKTGVDAFVAIWQRLPQYRWLAPWAEHPVVRPFLNFGYRTFALVRPYLPRRKAPLCEQSPYCETENKP